jgi:DNA-binding Lrp family transcriptional regulator
LGIAETVELEWGVLKHIRSSNRIADLHAYVWLNHLKRLNHTDGIIPKEEAVHYIMNQTGLSESTIKHRLRRLEKSGWILPVSRGYIIYSWAQIANLLKIHCERVVLVSKEELKDLKSFKSVIASIPGTLKEPVIKYEIAKSLGISTHTVKRNRRGRLREWYRVRYANTYESREQAEQAQTQELHPIHGWPLCLCGYKMYPTKLDKGTWVLERSSAARILDLVITCRSGKSKRLRKATAHLANTGGGVRAKTYQPMENSKRYTNFTPDIQMPNQPQNMPKTWKLPVHSLGEINTQKYGFNGRCYWGVVS